MIAPIAVGIVFLFFFSGCVSSEGETDPQAAVKQQTGKTVKGSAAKGHIAKTARKGTAAPVLHDPKTPAVLGQVRLDLSAVLQGLFYKLRNNSGSNIGTVTFDSSVQHLDRDFDLDLSGFALQSVSIRQDDPVKENLFHRRIQAVFQMADSIGRQVFALVSADYLIGDNVIFVRQAVAVPYYPDYAKIRFLVVPSSRLPSLKYIAGLPFEELFSLAAENALSENELKSIRPGTKNAYKVMAFNMARSKPGTLLQIRTSPNASRGKIEVKESRSFEVQGWSVAMVDGQFEFNKSDGYSFFVGIIDRDNPAESVVLSRFESNQLNNK